MTKTRPIPSFSNRRIKARFRRHKRHGKQPERDVVEEATVTRPLTALEILMEMGYPRERALQALREAVGDVEKATNLLMTRPQTDLTKLTDMGFPKHQALQALQDANGDFEKAIESFL